MILDVGVRTFGVAEGGRKPHTQNISPNREQSLNSSTYHDVDFRVSTTNSLERPSILQRLALELPIETVQPEGQDESPSVLSPEEEEIFKSRLSKIWEGMMTFPMTVEWKDIISRWTKDEWLSRITEHIPTNVKLILVSPHPPTPAQLKSLPWLNTSDGGVLAWYTEASGMQDSTDKTIYVYIGSASDCHGGLNARKARMLSPFARPHDEALKRKIKDLGLNSEGEFRFKTLFTVPFENGFGGDVMDVRALVILARWALMIWLGAVDDGLKPLIKDLFPWGIENVEYIGLAGDNPLAINFNGSDKAMKGENQKEEINEQTRMTSRYDSVVIHGIILRKARSTPVRRVVEEQFKYLGFGYTEAPTPQQRDGWSCGLMIIRNAKRRMIGLPVGSWDDEVDPDW
ncbi:hypothetical protein G7Y89_g6401 [Cudoniella acicularis]|uniref:Ubiquitin-like protease family profile domain-containing protein n=1 Tax=Cudoniella acicularis TaxID=354080 RepID=A0A8H4RKK7_9HELO|nr:hypothetical protein G7Y89_g6401 [Cudoniella acicularis]